MPLHYIIDGYNILNNPLFIRAVKPPENSRQGLIDFIKIKKNQKNKITVVFDGYPDILHERLDEPGMNIVFSRDKSADDEIKNILEASARPKDAIVISNDREILSFAKSMGARFLKVEEFVDPDSGKKHRQIKDAETKPGLNFTEISRINNELRKIWLK